MYFLQPLYDFVATHLSDKINHFPLVKLIFESLDKTIGLFLLFLVYRFLRMGVKKYGHKPIEIKRELLLWLFVFYLILLFLLTAFRGISNPVELVLVEHPLSDANFKVLTETMKLAKANSMLDFYYNSFGNILWFFPMGMLIPFLTRKAPRLWKAALLGLVVSIVIETIQFSFMTGVADIDDVLFNVTGAVLGHFIYLVYRALKKKRKRGVQVEKN